MASRNFTNLARALARAQINFESDAFKAVLVTATSNSMSPGSTFTDGSRRAPTKGQSKVRFLLSKHA